MGFYDRRDPAVRGVASDAAPDQMGTNLISALRSVARNWQTLAISTAASIVLAIVYLTFATAQFTATGLILMDTKSNASMRSNTPVTTDANVESANIESQIEVLKSERILRRVVESEHLVDEPALNSASISREFGKVFTTLAFWNPPISKQLDDQLTAAARALQKLVAVRRIGLTYAVEISVTMPDSSKAASIANAYAEAFIADQIQLREQTAIRASRLLQARTDELQSKAQIAENAVEQLKFSGSLEGESSASARVTLKNLESSAQTYRILHDKFLERYAETWQQQFLSLPDAQIASAAYPPQSKSAPKSAVVLAAAIFIGIALGLLRIITNNKQIIGL